MSKIPVVFASVMFAPKILASIPELVDYYRNDLARLRVIARDAAITIELWIRSRHGTWRFFQVTPSTLVEIDREGKRLEAGVTIAYLAGVAAMEQGGANTSPSQNLIFTPFHGGGKSEHVKCPVVRVLPHPPFLMRQCFPKTR